MGQKTLAEWPLGKIIVLILVAAFAGLVFDLRYEHNHILAKHEIGWTPIIYSGVAVVVGAAGLALWERGGRLLLQVISAAGFVVGALGFWYHGQGHILTDIGQMLSVWTGSHPNPVHKPPLLAPLAFAGIGLFGLLACSKHFTPRSSGTGQSEGQDGKRDPIGSVLQSPHVS